MSRKQPMSVLPSKIVKALDDSRPRFLKEMAVVPFETGVAVDGAAQLRVLKGMAWKKALPKLITLMDGTRRVDEVVAEMPELSVGDVRDALSTLYVLGLAENGGSVECETVAHPETLNFLRRVSSVHQACDNGLEAYTRLRQSTVVIVPSGEVGSEHGLLSSLLRESGVGEVRVIGRDSHSWSQDLEVDSSGRKILVSMSIKVEDSERSCALDDWCTDHGLPWVRVLVDGSNVEIGPIFRRHDSLCYSCFEKYYAQEHRDIDRSGAESIAASASSIAIVAIEITYFLAETFPAISSKDFVRQNAIESTVQRLCCPRVKNCERCLPSEGSRQTNPNSAFAFEDYVMAESRSTVPSSTRVWGTSVAAPMTVRKRFRNCAQLSLSPVTADCLDVLAARRRRRFWLPAPSINVFEVAALTTLSAGIRFPGTQMKAEKRWAATAGNLGSVELFLAAINIQGLSPGLYFYQAQSHSLASFERHSEFEDVNSFARRLILSDGKPVPDALILFTGAFHRVARKYGPFAYRLVNLDAGVALSQFLLLARSIGLTAKILMPWADDVIEHRLNLDPFREHCTAVLGLYPKLSRRTSGTVEMPAAVVRPSLTKVASTGGYQWTPDGLARWVYEESRLKVGVQDGGSSLLAKEFPNKTKESPFRINMNHKLVKSVLLRRNSIREYSKEPVSLSDLITVLQYAYETDMNDWNLELSQAEKLVLYVIGRRISGLPPAVYRYEHSKNELNMHCGLPERTKLMEMFTQPEFADAPVFVWIAGNLSESVFRYGAFGHRLLLLRAGAMGHRLWIAGLSVGLSGCLVAGLVPSRARSELGLHGFEEATLFGVSLGYKP